ncbi:MAG: hypothetical protein QOE86_3564 [Solirubrobacteraceae bacterium]|jgi:hypothetical protein|nr:hypothetical protein [Solirubrobacteraceae bacterium]
MRAFWYVISLFATGAVVLFVAFTTLAGISPGDAAVGSAVIAVVAALLAVRYVRLDYALRSQGGDPQLRDAYNRQRERRGF